MSDVEKDNERDSAFGPMAKLELLAMAALLAFSLASGGLGGH